MSKTYGWQSNHVFVNGIEITGFADGDDVLMLKRLNDSGSHKVGVEGTMFISLSADKSGEITLKLMQTGRGNKYLNAIANAQGGGPATYIPCEVLWQDTNRQDVGIGTHGYIKKPAELTRGATQNPQEWVIVVERLDELLGDPLFVGLATLAAEAG